MISEFERRKLPRSPILNRPEVSQKKFHALLPGNLTGSERPVFAEPRQAQAFAITISLFDQGLFTWREWTETQSGKLSERAPFGNDKGGSFYFEDWPAALETPVGDRTAIQIDMLADLKNRWEHAYRSIPHGEKVSI